MSRIKLSLLLLTPASVVCRAWPCLQAAKNESVENENSVIQKRCNEHPDIPVQQHPKLHFRAHRHLLHTATREHWSQNGKIIFHHVGNLFSRSLVNSVSLAFVPSIVASEA